MSQNVKLAVVKADQLEFIKQCVIKSAPELVKILGRLHGRKGRGKKPKEVVVVSGKRKKGELGEKKAKKKSSEAVIDSDSDSDGDMKQKKSKTKSFVASDSESETVVKKKKKKIAEDSDDEDQVNDRENKAKQREEREMAKRKEKEEKEAAEAEKRRIKEERRRAKEEKQRNKERDERNRRAEEEASKRRRKEEMKLAEQVERKRKRIMDSDEEGRHPDIVIESATDSDREMDIGKRSHSQSVDSTSQSTPGPRKPERRAIEDKNRSKIKDVSGKDRKQVLLEFNCITAPQLEIKEINDFLDTRDMLKEYGVTDEYKAILQNFPEEQMLTCDSDACPFLLSYEQPFSPLYQEARKKWTPTVNCSPTTAHLRNKCVNCNKSLSHVDSEVWQKWLGANSYYCSVKCVSGKVSKVLRENTDSEWVTVMNAVTGQTVNAGVYARELRSFFLLSPNWMPFHNSASSSTNDLKKKALQKSNDTVEKERKSSKPIPKKNSEQIDSLRNSTKTSFENALVERAGRLKLKMERSKIRELCEKIEEKLFEKCAKNLSHPRYRVWKQQFINNAEQEKAKMFVVNVLNNRLTVEKLISLEASQLRNPACWQVKPPANRKSITTPSTNKTFSPLDSIIGDDSRDTTGEHMSHAFSKTCKICHAKQLADAQEKLKKENEERELRERRERNKRMMEEFRQEEILRKEAQERKEREEADYGGDDDYGGGGGGGFDSPTFEPDISTFSKHRSSVEPSTSADDDGKEWKVSFRFYCGDKKLRVDGDPIFPKQESNYGLMKLMRTVIHDKGVELHSPVRIQEFLVDSYKAMNEFRSCSIAALRLIPTENFDLFREVLAHNIEKEIVGQFNIDRFDDCLSVFLFPHRGSEILHDTLAPLQYNIGTSEDCFILLFILQPSFGAQFKFSVRLSDLHMREQMEELKSQSAANSSWRPSSRPSSRSSPKNMDSHYQGDAGTPKLDAPKTPLDIEEKPSIDGKTPSAEPTLSATKTMIILNIIKASDHINDIVDSTKDFLVDNDVTEEDKTQVRFVIEQRIREEKKKRKADKKKNKGIENKEGNENINGSTENILNGHSDSNRKEIGHPAIPVNSGSVTVVQSIPSSIITPLQLPDLSVPPPTHLPIPPFNPLMMPPRIAPPNLPPQLPGVNPNPLPPVPEVNPNLSEREIVADAIRKGLIAPIPKELLSGRPPRRPNDGAVPSYRKHMIDEDRKRLEDTKRRIEEEERLMKEMERKEREQRANTSLNSQPDDPDRPKFTVMPSTSSNVLKTLFEEGRSSKKKQPKKKKKKEPNPEADLLLPIRFGRAGSANKRRFLIDPLDEAAKNSEEESSKKKKRGKRKRGGKKHKANLMAKTRNHFHGPENRVQPEYKISKKTHVDTAKSSRSSTVSPSPPPPPPPPPPPASISGSFNPPPPPPIFEVNKEPAPPPLLTSPPSTVPLPVPPPPAFASMMLPPPPPPPPDANLMKTADSNTTDFSVPPPSESTDSTNEGENPGNQVPSLMAMRRGGRPPMMRGGMMRGGPPPGWRGGPPRGGPPMMGPRGMMRGRPMPMRGGPMMMSPRGGPMPPRGSPRGRGMMPPRGGPMFFADSPRGRGGPPRGQW